MRHDEIKYVDELSDARGKFSVNTVLQFKKSLKPMPAGILHVFVFFGHPVFTTAPSSVVDPV
jgi:hypothetical protein